MHNEIKTVVTLDRGTTIELDGRARTSHIDVKLKHNRKIDGSPIETTEITFRMSDETIRNLIHALEAYR